MLWQFNIINTGQRINIDGGATSVSSSSSSCSNVDGEYNSESDEYNCGRDIVGCCINTNTSSNSLGITRQDQ